MCRNCVSSHLRDFHQDRKSLTGRNLKKGGEKSSRSRVDRKCWPKVMVRILDVGDQYHKNESGVKLICTFGRSKMSTFECSMFGFSSRDA